MHELVGVSALRCQQQKLRRQADELENDIEAIYEKFNICPDCEGRGYQTVLSPKRVFLGWPDSVYYRLCSRCQGKGEYEEDTVVHADLATVSSYSKKNLTEFNGRLYWG